MIPVSAMSNRNIFAVILLGAIAIVGIIGIQTYWVLSTWDINEEEFNKKVNLALYNVARELAELEDGQLPARNVVNQRSNNYYVVNIENEIDANNLKFFLQREFQRLSLHVDFEYAVFDCANNEMVYGDFCRYSARAKPERLELGNLPKYDKFTYYFGVKFPTRTNYLLNKMQLSVFFSFILALTIFFFIYAMYVILRQKRLSRLQKDFINNMTHEFKTPLSTIKIAADVFLNAPEVRADQRLQRYAWIVREQNKRLDQQVEKVLQIARIEKGAFELKPERLELLPLLRQIAQSTQLRAEELGGALQTDLRAEQPIVRADRLHLSNMIYNLLDNAMKYCKKQPEIILGLRQNGSQFFLTVEDRGPGIPSEYQNRIFDKFFRIPTGNVHNVKGFGLGLYYVKRICDAHHWKIELRSEPGKGAAFTITIPPYRA